MAEQDYGPAIAALRAAGHEDAAATVEAAGRRPPRSAAPAFRALDASPADVQRQREGAAVLEGLRSSGVGTGWISAGELMGDNR
jgi:hypothetical protein